MIKLLIGESPCTHWSIAQNKNREVEPSGIGWELFKNYLIAKEKFAPDYFLYENNKSVSPIIKAEISRQLGVPLVHINSALVSAQNRQRFYAVNWETSQPLDRGIMLRDVLETGEVDRDKAYCLTHIQGNARDYFKKKHTQIAFEPFGENHEGKAYCLDANYGKGVSPEDCLKFRKRTQVAEKVFILPREDGEQTESKQYRVDGESVTLCGEGGGMGAKTGLHTIPGKKSQEKVYEVKNGQININGKLYPIKLADGYWMIRKLTVTECCRLQGMPDWWFNNSDGNKLISDTQCYRGLGNGWQLDTVKHLMASLPIDRNEEIVCLSMYDGIGTGRRILEELGYTNVKYIAYEIDKYCIKVTSYRYPDILHMGDAFQVATKGG